MWKMTCTVTGLRWREKSFLSMLLVRDESHCTTLSLYRSSLCPVQAVTQITIGPKV